MWLGSRPSAHLQSLLTLPLRDHSLHPGGRRPPATDLLQQRGLHTVCPRQGSQHTVGAHLAVWGLRASRARGSQEAPAPSAHLAHGSPAGALPGLAARQPSSASVTFPPGKPLRDSGALTQGVPGAPPVSTLCLTSTKLWEVRPWPGHTVLWAQRAPVPFRELREPRGLLPAPALHSGPPGRAARPAPTCLPPLPASSSPPGTLGMKGSPPGRPDSTLLLPHHG